VNGISPDLERSLIKNLEWTPIIVLANLFPPLAADDLDPVKVMLVFQAKGENEFFAETISGFDRSFRDVDINHDGFLSTKEYVDNSRHFAGNLSGSKGFMNVSDNDGDGRVSRKEYAINRIITDEAKDIFSRIEPVTDWPAVSAFQWRMSRQVFVESDYIGDITW
jgi:hypothetical protein